MDTYITQITQFDVCKYTYITKFDVYKIQKVNFIGNAQHNGKVREGCCKLIKQYLTDANAMLCFIVWCLRSFYNLELRTMKNAKWVKMMYCIPPPLPPSLPSFISFNFPFSFHVSFIQREIGFCEMGYEKGGSA